MFLIGDEYDLSTLILEGEVADATGSGTPAFDGTPGSGTPAATPSAGTPTPVPDPEEEITWGTDIAPEVQKKLNGIIKREKEKERAKVVKQTQDQIAELEKLKKKSTLTEQEKQDLEARISEMSRSIMTKEQLAHEERAKLQRKYEQETKNLSEERDSWKNLFTSSTIDRAITDAASQYEAFQSADIIALLKPYTNLAEETDKTGAKTGHLVPKVKFNDVDGEGKRVTLDLTVPEAVKRMTELDRYGHLFKTTAKSGLGMSGPAQDGGRTVDYSKLSPEDYLKYREKILAGKA